MKEHEHLFTSVWDEFDLPKVSDRELKCECGLSYFDYMQPKIDKISKKLKEIAQDPKVAERGEELQRKLSTLTPEDLLKRFDI